MTSRPRRPPLGSEGPNYLREEITACVAVAPIRFDWFVQAADPMLAICDAAYSVSFGERQ